MDSQSLEKALEAALDRHLHAAAPKECQTPAPLAEAIRYSFLAPGKRIRPRLVLATAQMIGLPLEAALPAAAAIEMVHCFTLIHDDLPCMDDDDLRRGRPSNHKKYGEATALLAGDALMTLAWETLLDATPHVEPTYLLQALHRLAWASGPRGVIGGQAAEPLLHAKSPIEDMRTMHSMKTGALFLAAILLPLDLVGQTNESLQNFAAELGLAFQVADDLEDLESDQPTSVLFYLSAAQARQETIARLSKASGDLTQKWGQAQARLLTQIADEVIVSLNKEVKS
ncbi:polyprenyl synthetase family protein [Bdellovibrionota bacterium FG-1]